MEITGTREKGRPKMRCTDKLTEQGMEQRRISRVARQRNEETENLGGKRQPQLEMGFKPVATIGSCARKLVSSSVSKG